MVGDYEWKETLEYEVTEYGVSTTSTQEVSIPVSIIESCIETIVATPVIQPSSEDAPSLSDEGDLLIDIASMPTSDVIY